MTEPMMTSDTRLDWVEPEVAELAVANTAIYPLTGPDRGNYVDCTSS